MSGLKRSVKMEYERIEEIKRELESPDVSLLMLQDLKAHIEKMLEHWGKVEGKQFRIM